MGDGLPPGLYELLVTEGVLPELDEARTTSLLQEDDLGADDAPRLLAQHTYALVLKALRSFKGQDAERLSKQLKLVNSLVEVVQERTSKDVVKSEDRVAEPMSRLLAVVPREAMRLEAAPDGQLRPPVRPQLPLGTSDLLVNGPRDLRLGAELKKELASADRVDLLLSFLKWSGLRLIMDEVAAFLERRPGCMRVLTTTYMGATEAKAVEALVALGAHVKVSYDTHRTRLHAKAWLFSRKSGFSTAYVGSSNLSAAAMLQGLEWNVRLTQVDNHPILKKFAATFQQYWEEGEFVDYDPTVFAREMGQHEQTSSFVVSLQVRPFAHQQEILDSLATERERGHTRNLVVAATGTGKTVVAALDYKRLRRQLGSASLLFVAHRVEILEQARQMFRVVLQDGSFGEMLAAGQRPVDGKHVFAAVQSLHSERLEALNPKAYDVVIVDEFHHAAASTYKRLLEHVEPKFLIGLTATPERADGQSVLGWFDGRVAAEIRLWEALDQGLLCPFHYFGVADGTDLKDVEWRGGGYVGGALESLYTGHDARAALVLKEVHRRVLDPSSMRAVGFCAGVHHAEFMARKFCEAGINARAIHSKMGRSKDRAQFLSDFRAGKLQALFTVDLFNEGVDVPAIDTVLFLRPTQSSTVFLQQLGRGLRRSEGKSCLTVLDFIGNAHRKFRFDVKYRALIGGARGQVARQVEQGFPRLPPGCSMSLDRQSSQWVLDNIKQALGLSLKGLATELVHSEAKDLRTFLERAQVELADLYRPKRSWTTIQRAAGRTLAAAGPNEPSLLRAAGRMLHLDDVERLDAWRRWLRQDVPPPKAAPQSRQERLQWMLFALLGHLGRPITELGAAFAELWAEPALKNELVELMDVLADGLRRQNPLVDALPDVPLRVHASYSLDEIMAAFGVVRSGKIYRPRGQGVWWEKSCRADLLFITLDKTAQDYSPTTLYDDYPLSIRKFHWESQNSTSPLSSAGKRYVEGTSTPLLFVRARKKNARGGTMPYLFLGPASLLSFEGERPMRIVWRLEHDMPAGWYKGVKVAAGA